VIHGDLNWVRTLELVFSVACDNGSVIIAFGNAAIKLDLRRKQKINKDIEIITESTSLLWGSGLCGYDIP